MTNIDLSSLAKPITANAVFVAIVIQIARMTDAAQIAPDAALWPLAMVAVCATGVFMAMLRHREQTADEKRVRLLQVRALRTNTEALRASVRQTARVGALLETFLAREGLSIVDEDEDDNGAPAE